MRLAVFANQNIFLIVFKSNFDLNTFEYNHLNQFSIQIVSIEIDYLTKLFKKQSIFEYFQLLIDYNQLILTKFQCKLQYSAQILMLK